MADLKVNSKGRVVVATGDEKAKENLLTFVRHLDQESRGSKISPLLRSVRGRIENALPAIERMAYAKGLGLGVKQGYETAVEENSSDVIRAISTTVDTAVQMLEAYAGELDKVAAAHLPNDPVRIYAEAIRDAAGIVSREVGGNAS